MSPPRPSHARVSIFTLALLALVASCGGDDSAESNAAPTGAPAPQQTSSFVSTTATSTTGGPTSSATSSQPTSSSAATVTEPPPTLIVAPGTYDGDRFVVALSFESRIEGVTSQQLQTQTLDVLNDPSGWNQAGFEFVADDTSNLTIVLAEGALVDELCLPLETYSQVSCQNGPTVALNADRWREGGDDWDSSVENYRAYLINHEVGHLIGLRHPTERCPSESRISALMEPQTNNLQNCTGNWIPLGWEIEWARNRPIVVGPDPSWNGPLPVWPRDTGD